MGEYHQCEAERDVSEEHDNPFLTTVWVCAERSLHAGDGPPRLSGKPRRGVEC